MVKRREGRCSTAVRVLRRVELGLGSRSSDIYRKRYGRSICRNDAQMHDLKAYAFWSCAVTLEAEVS